MKSNPQFSIVVPVYNIEPFLPQCIDSVLGQTFSYFELILVDDGSTDKSGEICDNYKNTDNRVVVIHKKNGGLVSARESGVLAAKGNYVGYVDGDDWVNEKWLEVVNNVIQNESPDIIEYNVYKSTDGKNEPILTSDFRGKYSKKQIKDEIIPKMMYNSDKRFYTFGVLPAVWSKVFKREILIQNLCQAKEITFGEDVACIYNCILECNSFYGINDYLYYYRQNSQSMTKAYDKKRFERLKVLFEYLEKTFLNKAKVIENQYTNYKMFCLLYAILNEAKSSNELNESVEKCKDGIKSLQLEKFVENFDSKNLGIPWNVFVKLMKKNKYKSLLKICKLIVKIKYSYKE